MDGCKIFQQETYLDLPNGSPTDIWTAFNYKLLKQISLCIILPLYVFNLGL